MNNIKSKKIKAWAVIDKHNKIEYDAKFNGGDCCCSGNPEAIAVYNKRQTAMDSLTKYYQPNYQIVRCTITYNP